MDIIVLISSLIFSIISCFTYKKVWSITLSSEKIPSGYGFVLIFFILTFTHFLNLPLINIKVFIAILIFSSIYWIDDIKNLSFKFRLFLQFFCGTLIAFIILKENTFVFNNNFIIILICSGILNIFLTNIVNFYDGLDLNISVFTIIFSLVLIFLMTLEKDNYYLGLVILGFILGFGLFNFKPNIIFFGDSGCFVISCFINFIIVKNVFLLEYNTAYLLIPLMLPTIDVLYVVLLRIYLNESLLTRNYHHIYHKLNTKYKSKIYLLPQVINALGIFTISIFIIPNNNSTFLKFIFASTLLTIIFYFFVKFLIKKKDE
jgi:UDP-N-acetylmuramyl pentapeptide phosphotransferase/UDP-N-acetylglucosamine-1-phosphate transferase